MGSVSDRFILLGAAHGFVIDDLKAITAGSTFLYEREHELQNVLLEAYAEMAFVVRQFSESHADLLANGTPELPSYITEINELSERLADDAVIEVHAFDLSTYFKSFLLLAKGVLDKLVPLYSYRFYDNLKSFSDKGTRLTKSVRNNGHIARKAELIQLISDHKQRWIDDFIDLRDDYAHYSNLQGYQNFCTTGGQVRAHAINSIVDFERPSILVGEIRTDALDYMLRIKAELIAFLNAFLLLCEFEPGRRPKHYLNCECGYAFAKRLTAGPRKGRLELTARAMEMRVKDKSLDYAVIVCPKCRRTTDTDLQFWREEGFNFTSQPPSDAA